MFRQVRQTEIRIFFVPVAMAKYYRDKNLGVFERGVYPCGVCSIAHFCSIANTNRKAKSERLGFERTVFGTAIWAFLISCCAPPRSGGLRFAAVPRYSSWVDWGLADLVLSGMLRVYLY
jgi:hypothetical protein